MGADYIKIGRAKGASERTVILRHALRNALMPIITIVGIRQLFLKLVLIRHAQCIESPIPVFGFSGMVIVSVLMVRQDLSRLLLLWEIVIELWQNIHFLKA